MQGFWNSYVLKIMLVGAAMHFAAPMLTKSVAQGIEQLLIENVPVPQQRPQNRQAAFDRPDNTLGSAIRTGKESEPNPVRGSLKEGLATLDKGQAEKALAIRAGMPGGSLDRKILAWSLAVSGRAGIRSGDIAKISSDLKDWPLQETMRSNIERALAREDLSPSQIVSAFGRNKPQSIEGAIMLAEAHMGLGQTRQSNAVIAPVWKHETLDRRTETLILKKFDKVLTRDDHRVRMHQLLYRDRVRAALRIAGRAEQTSLAKARAAVLRKSSKAGALLKAVATSSKKDTGYLFARIEHARRSQEYKKAAELLLKATRDRTKLIDPDEWWVERRIVSRQMLELGRYKQAYRLAADHSASSASDIADAEFHAGWYAMRFLKDKPTARKHFARILKVSKRPISIARGHYWMGRASNPVEAKKHYREAARHTGTFYGQLAAVELGSTKLPIKRPQPSSSDRQRLKDRELYKAIKRLEAIGQDWRADTIYRHLAKVLDSENEIAILAADAERRGNHRLSLQIGKIAFGRGLRVEAVSWPLGAIPRSAKIGNAGRALAYAIARQESAFQVDAVSKANARGLLQLLPRTAKAVAKRNGLGYSYRRLTSDAGYNATLGSAYLSDQLERFDNSYVLTFAAYNAGPGRVNEWLERFGNPRGKSLYDVIDWVEQIPFTETRHYVQRVMENYQVYKQRISNSNLTIAKDLTIGRR